MIRDVSSGQDKKITKDAHLAGAIDTPELADASVTTAKVDDGAITSGKLAQHTIFKTQATAVTFGTTTTSANTVTYTQPDDCTKASIISSSRVQSLSSGTIDNQVKLRVNGSDVGTNYVITTTALNQGNQVVALNEVTGLTPGATITLLMRVKTSSNTGKCWFTSYLITPYA